MSKFIPNSFQLPNIIIDKYLYTLSDFELKVYLIIVRKTKGWQKEKDNIALSQFKKILRIKDDRTIRRALKGLLKLNLIKKEENKGRESTFKINLNFDPSHAHDPSHENVPTCSCKGTPSMSMRGTKEINKEEEEENKIKKFEKELENFIDFLIIENGLVVKNKLSLKNKLLDNYVKNDKKTTSNFKTYLHSGFYLKSQLIGKKINNKLINDVIVIDNQKVKALYMDDGVSYAMVIHRGQWGNAILNAKATL